MLVELAVRDLGVIAELRIPFGPGMSALTGETGAGKTMIIEALSLLLGGKADPTRVRSGASEAVIEGDHGVTSMVGLPPQRAWVSLGPPWWRSAANTPTNVCSRHAHSDEH